MEGNFEGLKGYAVGRMTKSHRGKLYIDDEGWGPEAGSIEYGYRVPFSGIHVFIGKIGEPGPESDLRADLIETAQRAGSARVQSVVKHAFVGCIHGSEYSEGSMEGGETAICCDTASSIGETDSLYQLQDGMLGGYFDGSSVPDPLEPPNGPGVFMAGTQPGQNSTAATAAAAGSGDPARPPAQVLMDLMDKLTTLLTAMVETADKAQHDAEVARVREEMVQDKENLAAEETRMVEERAALDARAQ